MYTPAGTFDSIDMDTGNIIEGSWTQDKDSVTPLHPLRRIARKSATTVKCNRDDDFFNATSASSLAK
jgi:hypothetical protein